MIKRLSAQYTLVVGGSGTISRDIIERVSEGSPVLVLSRNKPAYKLGQNVKWILADCIDAPQKYSDASLDGIDKYFIKNLVYTSSYQLGRRSYTSLFDSDITTSFWINSVFPMLLTKRILKYRPESPGSFIYFSSEAVMFGGNLITTYASSKAPLDTFVKGLSREVGRYGLRCNCISPSVVDSEKLEGDLSQLRASMPLGRLGKPMDLSNLVEFLLSERSSFVSGTTVRITGAR